MLQRYLQELKNIEWQAVREELTKGVYGKGLNRSDMTEIKMVLTKVEPSGEFPLHKDKYHHVFYFLKGIGKGWLGDKSYEIKPGLAVEVPAGELHGYKNTSGENLLLITLNIPIK
ncbi:MAG: cupin domain-containing protein [Candidatus Hodarchaeota archaeon]